MASAGGGEDHRATLLSECVARAGRDWAAAVRLTLRREGRPAEGGWPGTLSEARARALALELPDGMPPTARAELAVALYDAARRCWLRARDPRSPDLADGT